MKIELDRILQLARIDLKPEEKNRLSSQLEEIVRYFENLNGLDTGEVSPSFHAQEQRNVFRQDRAVPFKGRDRLLANAPEKEEDFFKVKRAVEEI